MTDAQRGHRRVADKFKQLALRTVGFQREYYLLMSKWHEDQATDWDPRKET